VEGHFQTGGMWAAGQTKGRVQRLPVGSKQRKSVCGTEEGTKGKNEEDINRA